ncbi:hypothetical protein [Sphingomonas sp. Leaf25]|uniref:hypothetical protein n=1 Tax=Sphingomonas sp. Leaf25 TaxID=1735692 RepID=UPI0006F9BC74|nr:hypothetical protein [Sphingomonas sp. Leaf25]KQN05177.1 hypothetical protein ASE78_16775 [Sphingomonas sp. Leaf25]
MALSPLDVRSRFVRYRHVGIGAVSILVTGCNGTEVAPRPQPTTSATAMVARPSADTLATNAAMRAVFGVERGGIVRIDGAEVRFDDGRLIRPGATPILVARGQRLSAAHPDKGFLGIWYLAPHGYGFRVTGRYPDSIRAGSFGNPPDWTLRRDLGTYPVIQATGFGQWFGHGHACTTLVALRPRKPVELARDILTGYSFDPGDDPAQHEPGETIDGSIAYDRARDVLIVTYRGTVRQTVLYSYRDGEYRVPPVGNNLDRC